MGWPVQLIFLQAMYFVHATRLRFLDFAGILAFNHVPRGLSQSIFAEAIVLGQMGAFGLLFAWLIRLLSASCLVLKGGVFGGFCWFVIYATADLFKVKGIYGAVDFKTAVVNLLCSAIWGTVLGGAYLFLNRRYGLKSEKGELKMGLKEALRDRFTRGLMAGAIGWLPEIIFTWVMFGLRLGRFKYSDIAGVLAWGFKPHGLWQELFAEFIMFGLLTTLGGIFSKLLKVITERNILIKGAIYGGSAWFIIYTVINLFKVKGVFGEIGFSTAVSNMVGALLWGLATGWALIVLKRGFGAEN